MTSPAAPAPLLALETSGRALGAALWGPAGLVAERRATEGARHGAALAPVVLDLLQEAGLKPRELAAVGVSLGPGSWTGLRIGLAFGKALAWGAGVPLVGVPSFEALALAASRSESASTVLCVRSAYTEGLYAALFQVTGGVPRRCLEECVLRAEALRAAVEPLTGGAPVVLCGDAVCLKDLAPLAASAGWRVVPGYDEIPPAALAERAWARLEAGEAWRTAPEIHAAAPLYLRASDPELKLQRKGG